MASTLYTKRNQVQPDDPFALPSYDEVAFNPPRPPKPTGVGLSQVSAATSPMPPAPGPIEDQTPIPPPQYEHRAAQDAYVAAMKTAPAPDKPKLWQRIAAGAVGGLAGYSNASGTRAPQIDPSGAVNAILYPGYGQKLATYERDLAGKKLAAEQEAAGVKAKRDQAESEAKIVRDKAAAKASEARATRDAAPSKTGVHVVNGALVDDAGKVLYQGAKDDQLELMEIFVKGPDGKPAKQVVTHNKTQNTLIGNDGQVVPLSALAGLKAESDERTAGIKEYEYAKASGFKGTYEQWEKQQANLKTPRTTVNVNTGKPVGEDAVNRIAEMRQGVAALDDLKAAIKANPDALGVVSGSVLQTPLAGQLAQRAGLFKGAAQLIPKIKLVKQKVGKALEGGVLRKEDEEKYRDILATPEDMPDVALGKIMGLADRLTEDLNIYLKTQGQGGRDVSKLTDAPAVAPKEQRNKKTGAYRHSLDGGKTWRDGRAPGAK